MGGILLRKYLVATQQKGKGWKERLLGGCQAFKEKNHLFSLRYCSVDLKVHTEKALEGKKGK